MLVQLLTQGMDSINESMPKSCCLEVNVCTGAIQEKLIGKESNRYYGTGAQYDFASK